MQKEIGGFFELDVKIKQELYPDAIKLNCGRNSLRYIVKAHEIKEIHIPFYTCPTVWQALQKENCKINFYHIDKNFFPTNDFESNDYILYPNYFGICGKNVEILNEKYKNLIVDNAHSFFSPQFGIASFNSARKFFGVTDGSYLFSEKILDEKIENDTSWQRFSHVAKRVDTTAEESYLDFIKNENSLDNQPIKIMSKLTQALLSAVDYKTAKQKRLENFNTLNKSLKATNKLEINLADFDVPMVYPYFTKNSKLREKLIANHIYVEKYWSPIAKNMPESDFQKYIIPLPLDQRYSSAEMDLIIKTILS